MAYAGAIVAHTKQPLAVLDDDLSVLFASPSFLDVMGAKRGDGALFELPQAALAALSQTGGGSREVEIENAGAAIAKAPADSARNRRRSRRQGHRAFGRRR